MPNHSNHADSETTKSTELLRLFVTCITTSAAFEEEKVMGSF